MKYRSECLYGLRRGVMNLIEEKVVYELMVKKGMIVKGQVFLNEAQPPEQRKTWRDHPRLEEVYECKEYDARLKELAKYYARVTECNDLSTSHFLLKCWNENKENNY